MLPIPVVVTLVRVPLVVNSRPTSVNESSPNSGTPPVPVPRFLTTTFDQGGTRSDGRAQPNNHARANVRDTPLISRGWPVKELFFAGSRCWCDGVEIAWISGHNMCFQSLAQIVESINRLERWCKALCCHSGSKHGLCTRDVGTVGPAPERVCVFVYMALLDFTSARA